MGVKMNCTYVGEQTVKNIHGPSKSEITTTAPVDVGGTGRYFSPTDLLACSLGCCALTTMGKLAETIGCDFEGSSVAVEKHVVQEPRRVGKLSADFKLSPNCTKEQREALEEAAYTCSVACTLKGNVELDFNFTYNAVESG
jgi:putative redox protein